MRRHFPLLLFLFFSMSTPAQIEIDSLEKGLKLSADDTNKVNLLNSIVVELQRNDLGKSEKYSKEAFRLALKLDFKKGIAGSYYSIGLVHSYSSGYDSALHYFEKSRLLYEQLGEKGKAGNMQYQKAIMYLRKGEFEQSASFFLDALKTGEEIKDKNLAANALFGMASIQARTGNVDKQIEYLQQVIKVKEELKDEDGMAKAFNSLGLAYIRKNDYETAISYFEKSLLLNKKLADKGSIANVLGNIAICYASLKQYEKAIDYYNQTMSIQKEIGAQESIASTYGNIGTTYIDMHKYNESIYYLNKSLEIAIPIDYKEIIMNNYSSLSDVYEAKEDYKNAYEYHKKYSDVKDSLLNEESSKQITEMQTKYETEKKEQQITLLNKDKELQDAQLNRQKIIIWSVAGGLLTVMILSLFIFRERKKSEKLLLNILPAATAIELKQNGKAIPRHYESVTVMFTDFKGFTTIAEKLSAEELVSELDFLFKKFDEIISKYNIEKIKTIGDAYMCASGLPTPNTNHAEEIVKAGIEIQSWMKEQNNKWSLRLGIHSGPVTAGVVGDKKFAYDIWGDTVNTASRMESSGEPGKINISGTTYQFIKEQFSCEFRGKIPAKNKGEIDMYFIEKNLRN